MMKYDDDVDDTYDDDDEDDDKSEDDYRNVRTFLHRVLSTLGRFGLNHPTPHHHQDYDFNLITYCSVV